MDPAPLGPGRRSFLGLGAATAAAATLPTFGSAPLAAAAPPSGKTRVLHVRDFGARPDDHRDDTDAIRRAIHAANAGPLPTIVRFDTGTYTLARDVEAGASLPLVEVANVILEGATDRSGAPATWLVTQLTAENDTAPATQLSLSDCEGIELRNLVLDYDQRATSSAEIVAVDTSNDQVTVDVFAGCTHFDGMLPYSANSWDLSSGLLNHVAPLTIGADPDKFTGVFRPVPGGAGRRYTLSGYDFTDRVNPGDGMSWHFNVTGGSYNILALGCRDVVLDNIRIHNAIGMGVLFGYGHNLTVRNVHVVPEGDDLAVGPRDAIHLSNSTGSLNFSGGHLKGVRWDPLVSRSSFLPVTEILGPREVRIKVGGVSRTLPFSPGDAITCWTGAVPVAIPLASATTIDEAGTEFLLRLAGDLPDSVTVGSLLASAGHEWDSVHISDTVIESNIGTALVFENRNLLLENCRFANNAYHDVGFGTTSGGTGSFARNVVVRNNDFEGSCWVRKYSALDHCGAVTTFENNGKFTNEAYNSNILIEANRFVGLDIEPWSAGVLLRNARDVTVRGNAYRDVSNRVVVDPDSTAGIVNADG